MHARKNTLPRAIAQYRRTVLASAAVFSIALTSACVSTPPQGSTENTPSPAAAKASGEKESPKPTPTIDNSVAGQTILRLEKQGIEIGETVKVKGGSYPQYKVTKESKLAKFDKSKHSDGWPKGWTQKDAEKGQLAAANFLANNVIDNPTLNDYEANQDQFISLLKKSVDPEWMDEFSQDVLDHGKSFNDNTFELDSFIGDKTKGFRYPSDGKTPRIANLTDLNLKYSQTWDGAIYYLYEGQYTTNVVDKNDEPYTMENLITYGISIKKRDGKFLIYGGNYENGRYSEPTPN